MTTVILNEAETALLTGLIDSIIECGPADDSEAEQDYMRALVVIRAKVNTGAAVPVPG